MAKFEKGKSGNPGGRPKDDHDVRELARKYSKEAVEVLAAWMRSDNAKASVQAANALLDRGYGKPVQSIHSTPNDPAELSDSELARIAAGGGARAYSQTNGSAKPH